MAPSSLPSTKISFPRVRALPGGWGACFLTKTLPPPCSGTFLQKCLASRVPSAFVPHQQFHCSLCTSQPSMLPAPCPPEPGPGSKPANTSRPGTSHEDWQRGQLWAEGGCCISRLTETSAKERKQRPAGQATPLAPTFFISPVLDCNVPDAIPSPEASFLSQLPLV